MVTPDAGAAQPAHARSNGTRVRDTWPAGHAGRRDRAQRRRHRRRWPPTCRAWRWSRCSSRSGSTAAPTARRACCARAIASPARSAPPARCWSTCCRCCSAPASTRCVLRADQSLEAARARARLLPRPLPGRRVDAAAAVRAAAGCGARCARRAVQRRRRHMSAIDAVRAPHRRLRRSASRMRVALLQRRRARARRPHRAGHQPGRRGHGRHRPDRAPRPADRDRHAARPASCTPRRSALIPRIEAALRPRRSRSIEPRARGGGRTSCRRNGERAMYESIELRKACCGIRKLEPLSRMLAGRSAWVTGLRREQSNERGDVPFSDRDDDGRVKLNPLADWSWDDVWHYIAHARRALQPAARPSSIPSIGCAPCTRAIARRRRLPRRPLVVGGRGRQGVRPARATHDEPARLDDRSRAHERPVDRRAAAARARPHATSTGSRKKRSSSCAKSPPRSSARPCCSRAARIRASCCAWPRRRSRRTARRHQFKGRLPFPLLHVDTGHNFPEVIEFRDRRVAEMGERLVVGHLEDSIAARHACAWRTRSNRATATRRVTLLEAIEEHRFDVLIGGARRDEEKARAKERIFIAPRQLRPMAAEGAAARAVDAVQHAHQAGRAHARVPDQQLDRARRLALHRAREHPAARPVLRARARGRSAARACWCR